MVPFAKLTCAEIAVLPPEMQLVVPTVTCAALNARDPGSIDDPNVNVVACEQGEVLSPALTCLDQIDPDDLWLSVQEPGDLPVARSREVGESTCEDAGAQRGGRHLERIDTGILDFTEDIDPSSVFLHAHEHVGIDVEVARQNPAQLRCDPGCGHAFEPDLTGEWARYGSVHPDLDVEFVLFVASCVDGDVQQISRTDVVREVVRAQRSGRREKRRDGEPDREHDARAHAHLLGPISPRPRST